MNTSTEKQTTRPEHFGTIECGEGVNITKPAAAYIVRRNWSYLGSADTLAGAMKIAEGALASALKSEGK